jgi:hypothetical protein
MFKIARRGIKKFTLNLGILLESLSKFSSSSAPHEVWTEVMWQKMTLKIIRYDCISVCDVNKSVTVRVVEVRVVDQVLIYDIPEFAGKMSLHLAS